MVDTGLISLVHFGVLFGLKLLQNVVQDATPNSWPRLRVRFASASSSLCVRSSLRLGGLQVPNLHRIFPRRLPLAPYAVLKYYCHRAWQLNRTFNARKIKRRVRGIGVRRRAGFTKAALEDFVHKLYCDVNKTVNSHNEFASTFPHWALHTHPSAKGPHISSM